NGVLGVARHIKNPDFRMIRRDRHGQFASVHSGHDNIGEEQIDCLLMSLDDLQGGSAVFGFENLVALRLQVLPCQAPQVGFIFDQQNRFLSLLGARKTKRLLRGSALFLAVDTREISAERRTAPRLAIDENVSSALLHDAVNGRKAKAGPLCAFGRKKWLEDSGLS